MYTKKNSSSMKIAIMCSDHPIEYEGIFVCRILPRCKNCPVMNVGITIDSTYANGSKNTFFDIEEEDLKQNVCTCMSVARSCADDSNNIELLTEKTRVCSIQEMVKDDVSKLACSIYNYISDHALLQLHIVYVTNCEPLKNIFVGVVGLYKEVHDGEDKYTPMMPWNGYVTERRYETKPGDINCKIMPITNHAESVNSLKSFARHYGDNESLLQMIDAFDNRTLMTVGSDVLQEYQKTEAIRSTLLGHQNIFTYLSLLQFCHVDIGFSHRIMSDHTLPIQIAREILRKAIKFYSLKTTFRPDETISCPQKVQFLVLIVAAIHHFNSTGLYRSETGEDINIRFPFFKDDFFSVRSVTFAYVVRRHNYMACTAI